MRSSLLVMAALAGVFVLVSAPALTIGNLMLAAFVWIGWKALTGPSSPLRRRGVRR